MVELARGAALALPGGTTAVREVVRVPRLRATEGGLDFIGEDVCGLGHPTPLASACEDTVQAEQGGEEVPADVVADGHPHNDQDAIWNVRSLGFYSLTMLLGLLR